MYWQTFMGHEIQMGTSSILHRLGHQETLWSNSMRPISSSRKLRKQQCGISQVFIFRWERNGETSGRYQVTRQCQMRASAADSKMDAWIRLLDRTVFFIQITDKADEELSDGLKSLACRGLLPLSCDSWAMMRSWGASSKHYAWSDMWSLNPV